MRLHLAALATLALAQSASADFFKCDLQLSTDGGFSWNNTAVIPASGGTIKSRLVLSAQRTAGLLAIASTSIKQFDVVGGLPTDSITNLVKAPTLSTANSDLGFDGNRIYNARFPAANLGFSQVPPSSGGVTDNPWIIESFDFNVAPSGIRTISFSAPPTYFSTAVVFTNANGTTARFLSSECSFDGAVIYVDPAPGTAMLLGLAGFGASRRRR